MVASTLAQGILPGLETAERLRMGRAVRESKAQEDMIALSTFNKEEQQEQLEAQAAQSLLRTMQGESVGPAGAPEDVDFGEFFQQLGTSMINAGVPKRGQELLVQSADYLKKQADIENTDATAQKTRLEGMIKAGGFMHNALATAGNESEYRHIWDTLPDDIVEIIGPENVQALKDSPWSPELQGYLRDRAMSIKDQATLVHNERKVTDSERRTNETIRHNQIMETLGQGNLTERRRTEDRMSKAGGSDLGKAPTTAEVAAARSIIINSIEAFDGLNIDKDSNTDRAVNHASQELVGRAKTILAENRGVETLDEALTQAFMEAEAAGDFEVVTKSVRGGLFWLNKSEEPAGVQYKRRGASQENPLPYPSDPSKLQRNKFYERNGIVGQYGVDFN